MCDIDNYSNGGISTGDDLCMANEAFDMFDSINNFFIEKIYPILKHYIRKDNGEICDLDIKNVLNFFKTKLDNNTRNKILVASKFRYALSSISDIIKSTQFKDKFLREEIDMEMLKIYNIKMFEDYKKNTEIIKLENKKS